MTVGSRPRPASDAAGRRPPGGRVVVAAVIRPVLTATVLVLVYFLLPVDRALTGWALVGLVGGLCLVVVVMIWQIRLILRSPYPALQGIEALTICVPLYLLIFANVDFLLAHNVAGSFTAPLTRTDALYFVVTVFATVGFGDITPVSQAARILVTTQMVGNLLLLGVALRVVLTAVEHSRRRHAR